MTYTIAERRTAPFTFFWITCLFNGFVSTAYAIDLDEAFVEASYKLGFFGEGATTDGTSLWIMEDGMILYRYDISAGGFDFTGSVSTETDGRGLAWDGTHLWLGSGTDTNSKIDPATGATVGTVTTTTPTGSSGGLTFDGTYLWKATRPEFNQFDPETGEVVRTIGGFDLPGIEEGLAFDGHHLYTITYEDNLGIPPVIWKIDIASGAVASDSFRLPDGKYNGLTFDGESLWAVGSTNETIYKISSRTKQVQIDIKPGSDENCLNINGQGVIPVAILGGETFDVTNVDQSTLNFGGLDLRLRGNGNRTCSLEHTNSDGMWDLVCHFEDDPSAWTGDDSEAAVTGELFDGTAFEGTDSICIVPRGRR